MEGLLPLPVSIIDSSIATPVPIQNSLLIRGDKHLFRIKANQTAQANTGG